METNFDVNAAAAELQKYVNQYNREHSIADLTPTYCELFGIRKPATCAGTAIASVVDHAGHVMDGPGKAKKAVLFCADACGDVQSNYLKDLFPRVKAVAGLQVESVCVMPSVTPVCYGSIFTGTPPAVHGIRKYERPVLEVETLFDVMAESGLNVAIVAINHCSIDMIFRQRKVDYYSFRSDEMSYQMTLQLIRENKYDVIVSYMTGYDSVAHKTGVDSAASQEQLNLAAERFETIARTMDESWKEYHRVLTFVPDHGQHPVSATQGSHGENCPDDMLVSHYYRID